MSKLNSNYITIPFQERPLNKIETTFILDNNEIEKIISCIKNEHLEDGLVGQKNAPNSLRKSIRECKVFWIPKTKEYLWLYKKIVDKAVLINNKVWNFDLFSADIPIQYVEYDEEYNGHYDWNLDIGNTHNSKRKLSISIQLSDDNEYQGGNLLFFNSTTQLKACRKKGYMTLFPSYLLHKVNPVTRGKRKALVLWITGPAFR